jgi:hypothetical protein
LNPAFAAEPSVDAQGGAGGIGEMIIDDGASGTSSVGTWSPNPLRRAPPRRWPLHVPAFQRGAAATYDGRWCPNGPRATAPCRTRSRTRAERRR